jgi:3-oxoacyl-[acyl-carrier-protein] synthase-1
MTPLRVAAEGLCSALGYTLPRSAAAIRSRLNLFRETNFVGLGGKPVVGALVHGLNIWGGQRQAALLRMTFDEVWERAAVAEGQVLAPASTALLLLLPPAVHDTVPLHELHEAFRALTDGYGLHPVSGAMHAGRGGVAAGIQRAAQWLAVDAGNGAPEDGIAPVRHVVVLASDSLLTAPTVERLLAQRRLAEDRHTDALLPGEAAAAIMLTRTAAQSAAAEVWITGAAHGQDDWRLDADAPLRAQALTAVMRDAARQSGTGVADAEFHASGMNGEHWMAREIELALSRSMERKRVHFPHHRIAQFIGDTGTAGAVATLAWITHEMRVERQDGQNGTRRIGSIGLLHFSEDDGQRSALMLRARGLAHECTGERAQDTV